MGYGHGVFLSSFTGCAGTRKGERRQDGRLLGGACGRDRYGYCKDG